MCKYAIFFYKREKEEYIFIIAFICIKKLSKDSVERNESDYFSGRKGVGIRWLGDQKESKTSPINFLF